jgi:hypothetical protein
MVADHYKSMTPEERFEVMASLRQTALAIVEASLPPGLTREERRYAIAKRFCGDELPEAALWAHAYYPNRPPTHLR